MTTIAAAMASASGVKSIKKNGLDGVRSLQELHGEIKEKC